jgi:hypothetical protein
MEPIRVHINFTMNRVEPKRVHQFDTMDFDRVGAKIASNQVCIVNQNQGGATARLTQISPRHICWPFVPSPGHIVAHVQSAVMARLEDLLPGLAAQAHSAATTVSFTFYWGKTIHAAHLQRHRPAIYRR